MAKSFVVHGQFFVVNGQFFMANCFEIHGKFFVVHGQLFVALFGWFRVSEPQGLAFRVSGPQGLGVRVSGPQGLQFRVSAPQGRGVRFQGWQNQNQNHHRAPRAVGSRRAGASAGSGERAKPMSARDVSLVRAVSNMSLRLLLLLALLLGAVGGGPAGLGKVRKAVWRSKME